ncbi:MAG: DUF2723 domain-containing protein [bacterium]|nr:DUF2723 domain-containing protein [bacterium]
MKKLNHPKIYFAFSVFALAFAVYLLTAPHSIFLGDNAQFVTAGATLGVPHPPGYPLFVVLAKLFSLVPLASLTYRINLVSVVAASFSLVFFYLVVAHVLEKYRKFHPEVFSGDFVLYSTAAVAAWLLGFSRIFWSQAIVGETYALSFLFFSMLLWLATRWWDTWREKYVILGSFAFGLGLAAHELLLLLLPVFLIAVFFMRPEVSRKTKITGWLLFLASLGLYFLLPLMSHAQPFLNWGRTGDSLQNFIDHLLRRGYGDFAIAGAFGDKVAFTNDIALDLFGQFSYLLAWSFFGLLALFRQQKRLFFLSLGVFFCNTLGIIFLRSLPYSQEAGQTYAVYYFPAYAMVALWIALAIPEIARLISIFLRLKNSAAFLLGVVAIWAAVSYGNNVKLNNLSKFSFLDNYSSGLLQSLSPHAVLLVSIEGPASDSMVFSLLYQRAVKNLRPDVDVVTYPDVFKTADRKQINDIFLLPDLRQQRAGLVEYALSKPGWVKRPIFSTFLFETLKESSGWESSANGFAYRLSDGETKPAAAFPDQVRVVLSDRDRNMLAADFFGADLLAQYYYALAALQLTAGRFRDSQDSYVSAIQVDNEPAGLDSSTYRFFRERVLKETTNTRLSQAVVK